MRRAHAYDQFTALLHAQPRASVLHGHIHRRRDHALARDVDGDELRPVA